MEQVSIIIPIYNSEQFLRDCLECVVKQTFKQLEIILVDDASTDSSGIICDEIAAIDSRVKVIHHKENKGLSLSKYDGYLISSGEWISFIDNDDLITYTMYENLMYLAECYKDAEIVCLAGEDIRGEGIRNRISQLNSIDANCENAIVRSLDSADACRLIYGHIEASKKVSGIFSATWGKIIKKGLFEKALKETIKHKNDLYWIFLEDVLFIPICIDNAHSVIFSDKICYLHRLSEINLSAQLKPSEYHYETIRAHSLIQSYFRDNNKDYIANEMLLGFLLNMQSVWYKVYKYETDENRKKEGLSSIQFLWSKYFSIYKKKAKGHKINVPIDISMYVFEISKKVWTYTIGDLYFKRKGKT